MESFACDGCDATLTAPLTRVSFPCHARQRWGNGQLLPVLLRAGTYAVDPEPFGPPWRPWTEVDSPEAHGVYAPVPALSFGPAGAIVIAPGDARGTVLIPGQLDGGCCGLDERSGPNLACARCDRAVATRVDDCARWQAVWLDPGAVHRIPTDAPTTSPVDWPDLVPDDVPPVDPSGEWSPRWAAEAGEALAHLVALSSGRPVTVPDGLVATMLRHVLEALLPPGPPAKRAALAGPGLPAPDPAVDLALVPRHPWTGKPWRSPGRADTVPLAFEIWTVLAFHRERPSIPATVDHPRDAPRPLLPRTAFRPDGGVFLHRLARLPAVREPALRAIHDQVSSAPYAHPF